MHKLASLLWCDICTNRINIGFTGVFVLLLPLMYNHHKSEKKQCLVISLCSMYPIQWSYHEYYKLVYLIIQTGSPRGSTSSSFQLQSSTLHCSLWIVSVLLRWKEGEGSTDSSVSVLLGSLVFNAE